MPARAILAGGGVTASRSASSLSEAMADVEADFRHLATLRNAQRANRMSPWWGTYCAISKMMVQIRRLALQRKLQGPAIAQALRAANTVARIRARLPFPEVVF